MASGLHTDVLGRSDLANLVPRWHHLVEHAPRTSVFQYPGWVRAWSDTLGRAERAMVITVHDGPDLVGVAPLLAPSASGGVRFAGHPLNDRNGVVAADGDRAAVWSATLARLARLCPGAVLDVPELDHADLAACRIGAPALCTAPRLPSPVLHLPAGRTAMARAPSVRRRSAWRRARRRLAEHGLLQFDWTPGSELSPNDLQAFHRARLRRFDAAGRRAELPIEQRTEDFGDFLARVVHHLPGDAVALGRLRVGDRVAAQNLYLRWPGVVLDYMQTFEPDLAPHSPGLLALLEGIDRCIAEGVPVLDLGRGDEPYKFVLGATARDLGGLAGRLP